VMRPGRSARGSSDPRIFASMIIGEDRIIFASPVSHRVFQRPVRKSFYLN
jgi:hypothetical protein